MSGPGREGEIGEVEPSEQAAKDKQLEPTTGGPVRWNFTKFLIGRDGKVFKRFEPDIEPADPELASAIEQALNATPSQTSAPAAKPPKPN